MKTTLTLCLKQKFCSLFRRPPKLSSKLAGWPTIISPGTVALSFSFAVVIGLFFGFYPAHKASLLNPIEALRYE